MVLGAVHDKERRLDLLRDVLEAEGVEEGSASRVFGSGHPQ